jgi:hypothetical protein
MIVYPGCPGDRCCAGDAYPFLVARAGLFYQNFLLCQQALKVLSEPACIDAQIRFFLLEEDIRPFF